LNIRSIVLLSGGLDSAANLALCRLEDVPVLALTADYGQRAAAQEIRAARALCERFRVRHEVVGLSWLGQLGGSALTVAARPVPRLARGELDDFARLRGAAREVWVPNRNGVLVNVAAAFAERHDASRIVVGFNREEAQTFPDNSKEFAECATRALALSTATGVAVHSYTAEWDKRRIVSELRARVPDFPFDLLWSCYLGGEKTCGSCESCRRLARALEEARP
jgi:7-cyano-7-deazaguanine synthase